MSEGGSLINLGELSKPATVLVEKISDAIGGIFRPYQTRRIAEAEADADEIRAVSRIRIDDLQRRAVQRFVIEETKKQLNIEAITQKALPQVQQDASPQGIEDDWITNFFDKCRLISDDEMQTTWSRILAGEANSPGRYSKRTVNLMSSLDKSDAELFRSLCSFAWTVGSDQVPLIYDEDDKIYTDAGVTFFTLTHLDTIGLLSYNPLNGFGFLKQPKSITISFYGKEFEIAFAQQENNTLEIGRVFLSKTGKDLATICGSGAAPNFHEYVVKNWQAAGLQVKEVTG
jgi:hypothetical protein